MKREGREGPNQVANASPWSTRFPLNLRVLSEYALIVANFLNSILYFFRADLESDLILFHVGIST